MILNYEIHTHTDHINLTHLATNNNNMRVNRKRLYLDQMDVKFHHIWGEDNVVEDSLSIKRLTMGKPSSLRKKIGMI